MSKANLANLQQALNNKASSQASMPPEQADQAASPTSSGTYAAPSRVGKSNITAYLSPAYKSNLRLIQARTNKSLQALIAEALNDLFEKYNVPTIIE